jgi:flagellar basal body-associated protein FliL
MEEIGNNNPSTGQEGVPSESFANIPASTAEVKVRTMKSDLASLAATGGGGVPQFNRVNVAGLSISKAKEEGIAGLKKKNKIIPVLLVVLIALAVLVAVWWLGRSIFSGGSAGGQGGAQSISNLATATVQTYQSTSSSPALAHISLFREPVDATVAFSLLQAGGAAATANDLQTYNQQISTVFAAVNKSANFIEINAKGANGNNVSVEELLSGADAEIIDSNFLATHFNPDATFFAYRGPSGFLPGYIIALRPGENQISVKNGVKAIESSAKIGNIFFTGVGAPSPSGFTDAVIAGTTVRVLNFTGSNPASFVYGWFQSYLIISASQDGFAQAVAHLQ